MQGSDFALNSTQAVIYFKLNNILHHLYVSIASGTSQTGWTGETNRRDLFNINTKITDIKKMPALIKRIMNWEGINNAISKHLTLRNVEDKENSQPEQLTFGPAFMQHL
jgi:hypothetical protein